jgi:ubiquinone/menaquinone biosynthesis C-methylase UbiE
MSDPSWFPEELGHAGPEHLDPTYVAAWDTKAAWDPAEDVDLLLRGGIGRDSVVLDLGAGTGTFALAMAPRCARVIAADISPAMVEAMHSRSAGLPNVEVVRAGFLTYAAPAASIDAVFTRHALHQLPDFWKVVALIRIHRLLAAGGLLRVRDLFLSVRPADLDEAVEAWLAGATAVATTGWTRRELEAHLREEHSTFTWLFEPMLTASGFEIVGAERSPNGIYAAYTCRKR